MDKHRAFGSLRSQFDSVHPHHKTPEEIKELFVKYREGWVGPCSKCTHYDGMGECKFWKRDKDPTGGCPVKSIAFKRRDETDSILFWM